MFKTILQRLVFSVIMPLEHAMVKLSSLVPNAADLLELEVEEIAERWVPLYRLHI